MARGRYVAYLGHDDLWLSHHLEGLVRTLEQSGADVAYSLGIMIGPPGSPVRLLTGATKSGAYEPGALIPPSTVLHRTDIVKDTGGWQDYRAIHTPSDLAFLSSAWAAGKRFAPLRELTVLKFPAPWRKDVYRTKPSFEQEAYLLRLNDASLVVAELTALALAMAEGNVRSPIDFGSPAADAPAGWLVDQWRESKGLPLREGDRINLPLYRDLDALRSHNNGQDIVPPQSLAELRAIEDLPPNGIFLGRGWHALEHDGDQPFRWLDTEGELIFTNLSTPNRTLVLDVESGPSRNCEPFEVQLVSEQGRRIAAATVSYRHLITLEASAVSNGSSVVRLVVPSGGSRISGDTRILNLRVFQINWGS